MRTMRTTDRKTGNDKKKRAGFFESDMSRDNQLSSSVFDGEIAQLLQAQLSKAVVHFGPSLLRSYKPELDLALHASLFSLSFGPGSKGVSEGQRLQNVHFDPERVSRGKLVCLGLALVAGPYAWSRVREAELRHRWAQQEGWRASEKLVLFFL